MLKVEIKNKSIKKVTKNNLNWIGLIHQTHDPGYETGIPHKKQIKK
jgi:hypothetical protein